MLYIIANKISFLSDQAMVYLVKLDNQVLVLLGRTLNIGYKIENCSVLSTESSSEKVICEVDDEDQDPTYVPDENDSISDSESEPDSASDIYPVLTEDASGKFRNSIYYPLT